MTGVKGGRITQKEFALKNGVKFNPGGTVNSYSLAQAQGRLGSRKDSSWVRDPEDRSKGHHSCCGSKRDYYHKHSCTFVGRAADDLSDLKDIV